MVCRACGALRGPITRAPPRAVDAGMNVVLEIGLIRRLDRERFYRRVDAAGHDLVVHVLDAGGKTGTGQRNAEKGETFSIVVPPRAFEMASDMWESPDEVERRARI